MNEQEEETGGYNRRGFFLYTWTQLKGAKQQPKTMLKIQIHIYRSGFFKDSFAMFANPLAFTGNW